MTAVSVWVASSANRCEAAVQRRAAPNIGHLDRKVWGTAEDDEKGAQWIRLDLRSECSQASALRWVDITAGFTELGIRHNVEVWHYGRPFPFTDNSPDEVLNFEAKSDSEGSRTDSEEIISPAAVQECIQEVILVYIH